jgi:16S rRNA (guanine527-N7)-methyltransferase
VSDPADADTSPPPTPHHAAARALFGERLPAAERFAYLLTTEGIVRGLIGPREAPRIWERHLLNCAAVGELIPPGASVIDVGSGAGLPGLVLAVARPDLEVTLVEPMARRTTFLAEVVERLGLDTMVTVERSRAEDAVHRLPRADVVTARALARLDRLAGRCLPLAKVGGRVLAFKGASAAEEVAAHRTAITALGGGSPTMRQCGVGLVEPPPAVVVEIVREWEVPGPANAGPAGGRDRRDRDRARRSGAGRTPGRWAGYQLPPGAEDR